jgi:hypothetical protein
VGQHRRSDFARFCDAVCRAVNVSGFSEIRNILVIGFGSNDEFIVLSDLYPDAHIVAIDIDSQAVAKLQKFCDLNDSEKLTVAELDARRLTQRDTEEVDLTIIRHPNVDDQSGIWALVLSCVVSLMRARSILVITTFSLSEMEFVLDKVNSTALSAIPGAPYSIEPVALSGADRHIGAFLKLV